MLKRFFLNALIVGIVVNGPISVWFIGYGLSLVAEQLPLWGFLLLCFSELLFALGIAALIDDFRASLKSPSAQ